MTGRHGAAHRGDIGRCPVCGKKRFTDRKAARRAARDWFPGQAMNAYQCGEYWHIGHPPPGVREGKVDRRDLKVPTNRRRGRRW